MVPLVALMEAPNVEIGEKRQGQCVKCLPIANNSQQNINLAFITIDIIIDSK
jgi:hypothetical protein